ncbi:MAG: OmpH family outer membrane protein [Candidatus Eisenbacteria bacterium]|uniref:OmpH family outer membrane protein n=1 Tax=Eiseniibacteriota bacterium TaxID=2212470 RepID=A0A538TSQ4_UNCEI|nr:MAG: OmpH family outer membrane protein [Candidatus Eisenbacteria bacterium]
MTIQRSRGALVWALAGVIVALFAGAVSVRADIKIGFIDSDRIFAEYPKTREAQESFNREVQELSKTAKEKKTEIDELQRKLDQQGPMLSEAKKDEQNREIQRKSSEYETFVQTNWGPGGRISKLNEEYLKPIVDRVHAIVAEFGTEEGYSLILDKALDLTDRVLLALRQEDEGTRRTTPRTNQGSGTNQNTGNQGQQ